MGKDVLLGPAGKIEQGAGRQEVEARLGEGRSILPRQSLVELLLELVQVANVARGIFALGFGQLIGAPVAGLLLLLHVDIEQFLDQVLEAVARCRCAPVVTPFGCSKRGPP